MKKRYRIGCFRCSVCHDRRVKRVIHHTSNPDHSWWSGTCSKCVEVYGPDTVAVLEPVWVVS